MAADLNKALDAEADAFARLLALSPDDPDEAFRAAARLAQGLFPHQIEGVAFLLGRRRAILADDMGLGKTRQAIVALRHAAPHGPFLVVCPASVKRNWAREVAIMDPAAASHVIGSGAGVTAPSDVPAWTIVNYDVIGRHIDALARISWAGLVFDEAHYLKNHRSARSRLARQLADSAKALREETAVYLLTGTPLTNRPRDLFVLLQLAGHPLGRSFLSFAKRYCDAERNDFGWETRGASNIEELTVQLHGVMLRRSKDEVLSLPPKIRTWLPVDVPSGTGVRDMRKVVELLIGDEALAPRSGVDERRLRGRLLAAVTRARQRLADVKVGATVDLVAGAVDQGEKVVVFSCFEEPVQKLAEAFRGAAVLLTGETPAEKRQAMVDRFQEEDRIRVFVANIIAGGVGTNLTAATQVVFNDLDWVPANHWQAEDRAYRMGQTRTVNVTYMVAAGTIDDFVQMVLEKKARLVSAVVDGTAMAQELSGDVLGELRRTLRELSSAMPAHGQAANAEHLVDQVLARARMDLDADRTPGGGAVVRSAGERETLRRALEMLARALSAPSVDRYRYASSSHPGVEYEIAVDGADVSCTCPGFEYRGQCRHARDVKAAVVAGTPVPAGYRPA